MSTTPSPEPVPEHDYAGLLAQFAPLAKNATAGEWEVTGNGSSSWVEAPEGARGMEHYDPDVPVPVVRDAIDENEATNSVDLEFIAWCGTNRAGILAALRIARLVTAPTDDEAEQIGRRAAAVVTGGEESDCGEPWVHREDGAGVLAAIAKIAQGAGSE